MKISIDKTMDDIVSISNQISGLKLLLDQKKKVLSKYFESSGKRQLNNDDCTVYVKETTTVNYDVPAIIEKVGKKKASIFIDKEYRIIDWDAFVGMCKKHGISPDVLKSVVKVSSTVNQAKLNKLYERGVVTLSDLQGCYDATVSKSVVLRLKNVERTIPIKEGND